MSLTHKNYLSLYLCFLLSIVFISFSGCKNKAEVEEVSSVVNIDENISEKSVSLPDDVTFWSDYPDEELADKLVSLMNDEELLSQILMFGWSGDYPSQVIIDWVDKRSIGSVKVYGWSTNDVVKVASAVKLLQEKAAKRRFKIPLYVATDQEGGWIRHVKGSTSDTPGNLAIGASGVPLDAYYSGYYIAKELRAIGINMNFAPTVDLYSNQDSTVIGPRSFSEDAEHTGILGNAFCKGSMDAGVIPTAKHFPGHGDTGVDSHGRLPIINIDEKTLFERELVPFQKLIENEVPAIMVGHLGFPQITNPVVPTTLSSYFIEDILRERLGYKGLIITDDMMMNGATAYAGSFSVSIKLAIEAGNDIIISSTTPSLNEAAWTVSFNMMKNRDFKEKVKTAARRVILTKLKYFKGNKAVPLYPDIESIPSLVPDKEGAKFFLSQACRSMTKLKDSDVVINPSEKVLLVGPYTQFFQEGLKRFPKASKMYVPYAMDFSSVAGYGHSVLSQASSYDAVIFCVADSQTAQVASYLKKSNKKVVIVSSLAPVPVFGFEQWASEVLLTYSYSPYSFQAAFGVISGDFEAKGILPLTR